MGLKICFSIFLDIVRFNLSQIAHSGNCQWNLTILGYLTVEIQVCYPTLPIWIAGNSSSHLKVLRLLAPYVLALMLAIQGSIWAKKVLVVLLYFVCYVIEKEDVHRCAAFHYFRLSSGEALPKFFLLMNN